MKQETLEEAAENNYPEGDVWNVEQAVIRRLAFMKGAKWQQEQDNNKFSEKDVINALHSVELKDNKDYTKIYNGMQEWFEQFKKK